MSRYLEKAAELRKDTDRHYNCAQSVVIPFSEDAGLDEEMAYKVAAGFGGGMRTGSVCGAITGGIMALGILGLDTPENVHKIFEDVKSNHEGLVDCKDLLALNKEKGLDKANHCDNMVFQVVSVVEQIVKDNK